MSHDIYGNDTNALRQEISELQNDLRDSHRQIKALRAALQNLLGDVEAEYDYRNVGGARTRSARAAARAVLSKVRAA